jgi:hypothetical protein
MLMRWKLAVITAFVALAAIYQKLFSSQLQREREQ